MELICKMDFFISEPTAVSIGKFDGEHRGHRKIMETMKRVAAEQNLRTAVFTFQKPPMEILSGKTNLLITTDREKLRKFTEAGIDYVVEYPFTEQTAGMEAEDFVKNILIGQMNMKAVVAGTDCAFGRGRSGNAEVLTELGRKYGFTAVIIGKEKDSGRDISSSFIREELSKGNIEKANALLGECYSLEGTVISGNQIGKKILGYPTINILPPEGVFLPRQGVYRTKVRFLDKNGNESERVFQGITNIGKNPSVEKDVLCHQIRIETFLTDFSEDLYGGNVRISFLGFIRPEMKFSSMEELKKQIAKDLETIGRK